MAQLRAVADVPADRRAPAAARGLVRAVLRGWQMVDLTADAELVVSELVTTALRPAPGVGPYQVEIVQRPGGVRISWLTARRSSLSSATSKRTDRVAVVC